MKNQILIFLVLILGVFLRIYQLSKFPNGFYSDEAAFAYNAYSILLTSRDEFGTFLPVLLKSFGDYKAALFAYYLAPFIYLGGLSVIAVRLGSAFLGIIQIILAYIIVREISSSRKFALLSSFLIAVSPFALQFNRMVHENNLSTVLIAAYIYFFLKIKRNFLFLVPALLASVLSLYAYHDARIITPLFVIFFTLRNLKLFFRHKLLTFFAFMIALILTFPLLNALKAKEAWTRVKKTSIFTDYGMLLTVNVERGESKNTVLSRIFHNKFTVYSRQFLENYLTHFDYTYVFFKGDPVQIYKTVGTGIHLFSLLPFLYIGLLLLPLKNKYIWSVIFFWLLISPLSGAFTRFIPSASRTFSFLFPLCIFSAYGIWIVLKSAPRNSLFSLILSIIIGANLIYYLHYYYFNTFVRFSREWHFGMDQVIEEVVSRKGMYDRILFSTKAWGYLYPLFFEKYPPGKFQPQASLGPLDEYGFGWINSYDNYSFGSIPKYYDFDSNMLYIAVPEEINFVSDKLGQIRYPDGTVAFNIYDTSEVRRLCPDKCNLKNKPLNLDIYGSELKNAGTR